MGRVPIFFVNAGVFVSRAAFLCGIAAIAAAGSAQSLDATSAPALPPAKTLSDRYDAVERALVWLRRTGLARTATGRHAAERLVATLPDRFKGVQTEVIALQKRLTTGYTAMGLKERQRNLEQLWKLRGSIDVLALLEPRTLQTLTGLAPETLADLSRRLQEVTHSLRSR